MKFKLDKKKASTYVTQGVGAVGGTLISKGAMSVAPEMLKSPAVRGAIGVTALVLASAITGASTLDKSLQGVALGVGIQQTSEAIAGLVKPSLSDAPQSKGQKFISAAFNGLNGSEMASIKIPQSAWRNTASAPQTRTFTGFAAV